MNDDRSLAEQMNAGLGLDPGFVLDHGGLADEARDEIDDTVAESEAAHDATAHPERDQPER